MQWFLNCNPCADKATIWNRIAQARVIPTNVHKTRFWARVRFFTLIGQQVTLYTYDNRYVTKQTMTTSFYSNVQRVLNAEGVGDVIQYHGQSRAPVSFFRSRVWRVLKNVNKHFVKNRSVTRHCTNNCHDTARTE